MDNKGQHYNRTMNRNSCLNPKIAVWLNTVKIRSMIMNGCVNENSANGYSGARSAVKQTVGRRDVSQFGR